MKTEEKNPQSTLAFQKQLSATLKNLVDSRTQLICDAALLANDGKDKEWPTINSKVKFIKNKSEKEPNETLNLIIDILKKTEEPIIKLEKMLDLKNSVLEAITEQSFKEEQSTNA